MATLRCPCGNLLNNHADNNETQGYLLTEQNVLEYEYSRYEDATEWATEAGRGVWECQSCGRLAFDWPLCGMSDVKWYTPEDGQPGRLMARTRYEINDAVTPRPTGAYPATTTHSLLPVMANNRLFIRNRKTGEFTGFLKSFGGGWKVRKTAEQIEKDVAELFDDASFGNCFGAATDLELVTENDPRYSVVDGLLVYSADHLSV